MNRIILSARYLALIGVVFGLFASAAASAWGAWKTVAVIAHLAEGAFDGMALVDLAKVMDAFLIAAALLLFALGMYSTFIRELALPAPMGALGLDSLKSKLASIIIVLMAVSFLERLEMYTAAREVLYVGAAVALVSLALLPLIAFHQKG